MPTTWPPSNTGSRRTCRSAIFRAAAWTSSPGETVTGDRDMMSCTGTRLGSSPAATQRVMMSRSVTMPMSLPLWPHTGRAPRSWRLSSRAARAALSSGAVSYTHLFVTDKIQAAYDYAFSYRELQDRVKELEGQVARMDQENRQAQTALEENERLRDLLDLRQAHRCV